MRKEDSVSFYTLEKMLLEQELRLEEINEERKENIEKLKDIIKQKYTEQEIDNIEKFKDAVIEKYQDITVLPLDAIISNKLDIKLDVPLVIKKGTTYVSATSISQALDAEFTRNIEEGKVIISAEEDEIVLNINSSLAYVNGDEKELEYFPEIINGVTIVPLRFVVENLGLTVFWYDETKTIELDE